MPRPTQHSLLALAGALIAVPALLLGAPAAARVIDVLSDPGPPPATSVGSLPPAGPSAPIGLLPPVGPSASAGPSAPTQPWPPAGPAPAGGSVMAGQVTSRSAWSWPLAPRPTVLRRFQVGPHRWSPGHRGVDLAGPPGRPVLAPADGVVAFAGTVAGRGVLVIDHPGGLRSSFEPVTGSPPVGSQVRRGEPVAVLGPAGSSHCRPGGCLHWGVRRGEEYLDPLQLLGLPPPIVLLPVS